MRKEVMANHEVKSEVGSCIDQRSFSISYITAGKEIESEAGMYRLQSVRTSADLF